MIPAVADDGPGWTQMEWISFIRGKNLPDNPRVKLSMVTTLRPEKELQYRTMHQAVWPGVIDEMIRRNNRNFSAFLCEIDDELYEFLYVEYVGSDAEKDNALSQQNSINRRWWKLTDECQKPLPRRGCDLGQDGVDRGREVIGGAAMDVRTTIILGAISERGAVTMTVLDYAVFWLYVAVLLIIGAVVSYRQRANDDLFLGGRSLGWVNVGFSIFGTNVGPAFLIATCAPAIPRASSRRISSGWLGYSFSCWEWRLSRSIC